MGNLGWYQRITTWSKKVGGPQNLLFLSGVVGYGVLRGVEALGKKTIKLVKENNFRRPSKVYTVIEYGLSNEGLVFNINDKFTVWERDGDSILIEKVGDEGNPYFVSSELLHRISDYKG